MNIEIWAMTDVHPWPSPITNGNVGRYQDFPAQIRSVRVEGEKIVVILDLRTEPSPPKTA